MAQILDGKKLAKDMRLSLKDEVEKLADDGVTPGLAVILVGDDPASQVYVASKEKACKQLGIDSHMYRLSQYISQNELIELIDELNGDNSIDGILVQLPLPNHIDENAIIEAIRPDKDVDGFHPQNVGRLCGGREAFVPCTPLGVMHMLKETGVKLSGLNAVVVGRSNIVGKPMGTLLLSQNCTVTTCHSRTKDLKNHLQNADIVVAAVGNPKFITADMIKDGAIVIDVGINRLDDGSLCGDVDFDACCEKASYITPVPGGVGPMTIAMLMHNTVKAAKLHANLV